MKIQKIPENVPVEIINSRNYWKCRDQIRIGEVTDSRSETVPDQHLSVRQILRRYGMGLGYQGKPMESDFDENVDNPDWEDDDLPSVTQMSHMDRIDRIEMRKFIETELKEEISNINRKKEAQKVPKSENPQGGTISEAP